MSFNNSIIEVSVVIPVFNGSKYIVPAVNSVLQSDFENYEIILIDDCSTDNSSKVCELLSNSSNKINFYKNEVNIGLPATLNKGLKLARGKYIARLNQDDIMSYSRIGEQHHFLNSNSDVVVVGSHIQYVDESGTNKLSVVKFEESDRQIRSAWLLFSPFADPSVMYRKDAAIKVGGYEVEFWPADDSRFWYKMGTVGKLANIAKPLTTVRIHNEAGSIKHFRLMAAQVFRIKRWVHKTIQKAPLWVQAFWLAQLISSNILSPKLNWSIYRYLKSVAYMHKKIIEYIVKK